MDLRFFLVEDDPVARQMLRKIINEGKLGEVIGEAADGADVDPDLLSGADITMIDFLMKHRDGIETIRAMRSCGYNGKFIMISQIENKQMVEEAYLAGVEYFIHKPINKLEVYSVLQRVAESIRLTRSLETIRDSLSVMESLSRPNLRRGQVGGTGISSISREKEGISDRFAAVASGIVGEIGLQGESGIHDIMRCLLWLRDAEERGERIEDIPTLQSLYSNTLGSEAQSVRDVKAMEQRIRRAVFSVLTHLASLGLADFGNPTFEQFAPRLFEFHEVRQRMKELESDQMNTKCKVNIRKFLMSMYSEVKRSI